VEIIVGLDDDDKTSLDAYAALHEICRPIISERHRTLGQLCNALAEKATGQYLFFLGDDYVLKQEDWPQRILDAAKKLPNDIGVLYPRCAYHPRFANLPIISRKHYEALGYFMSPTFPFWFIDTGHDEIGELLDAKIEVDLDTVLPDGKGNTHGLRDIEFWARVFEATRIRRVTEAAKLAEIAYPEEAALKACLGAFEAKCRWLAEKVIHLRSPAFVKQWESRSDDPPSPRYLEAKAEAQKILNAHPVKPLAAPTVMKEPANKTTVMIGVPSTGFWHADMANNFSALCSYSFGHNIAIATMSNEGSMITRGRNDIVKQAMRVNAQYLLFIDSDLTFPTDALLRLLAHKKDIVGATYNQRVAPFRTLGRLKVRDGETPLDTDARVANGGIHEAGELPGGMMLIKTDVYRRMPWPWYYETYYRDLDALKAFRDMLRDHMQVPMPRDLEDRLFCTPGLKEYLADEQANVKKVGTEYISEDINFCRKAQRYGYRIWCDLDLTWELQHIGKQHVTCRKPGSVELPQAAE
jgi:glycosyltransferase involved in cell wall biosynthesis